MTLPGHEHMFAWVEGSTEYRCWDGCNATAQDPYYVPDEYDLGVLEFGYRAYTSYHWGAVSGWLLGSTRSR